MGHLVKYFAFILYCKIFLNLQNAVISVFVKKIKKLKIKTLIKRF